MLDQTTAPAQVATNGSKPPDEKPKPQEVTVTLPDIITADLWLTFVRGRNQFMKEHPDMAFGLLADYAGACEAINAGFVTIKCSDEMRAIIRTKRVAGVDTRIIGWIVKNVGGPIDAAQNGPLPDSMRPLSSP